MQKRYIFITFIVFLITACAPSSMALKPEDKQGIRTIAILQIDEPQLRMLNLGSGMAAMGVIGAAAIAANDESSKLASLLKKEHFSFSNQFTNDLHKQLRAAGYKTTVVKLSRKDKRSLLEDYSTINVKADAILDVVVTNMGYVTEHFMFSPHWRPEARAFVALIDTRDKRTIYTETFLHGYHNPFMTGTELDSSAKYHFEESEDVFKADSKLVVAGLKEASTKISRGVFEKLKK